MSPGEFTWRHSESRLTTSGNRQADQSIKLFNVDTMPEEQRKVAEAEVRRVRAEEEDSKKTKRKAWLFANGDYNQYCDFNALKGPYQDVKKVEAAIKNNRILVDNTWRCIVKRDLTVEQMRDAIQEVNQDTITGDIVFIPEGS